MKSSLTATAEADAAGKSMASDRGRGRVEKRDIAIDFFSGLRLPTSRFFSYLVLHSFIKVLKTVACFIHFFLYSTSRILESHASFHGLRIIHDVFDLGGKSAIKY